MEEKLEIAVCADKTTTAKIHTQVYRILKESQEKHPFNRMAWKFSEAKEALLQTPEIKEVI